MDEEIKEGKTKILQKLKKKTEGKTKILQKLKKKTEDERKLENYYFEFLGSY
jgi:hypothetical protein